MLNARKWLRAEIGDEFAGARLGDVRRTSRLQKVAEATDSSPKAGFPQMVETEGELEGLYRFLTNEDVSANAILEPHIAATMARAGETRQLCLMLHDTTAFEFSGDREGLGLTQSRNQGFYGHYALAVLPGATSVPLGVCGLERLNRKVRKNTVRKHHSYYTARDPNRESLRWSRMLESIEMRRDGFECIHVMDREGDIYDLMALALRLNARFIIRGDADRALADEPGFLVRDLLTQTKPRAGRKVYVSAREPKRRERIKPRRGAERKQRVAKLKIGSHAIEIRRPRTSKAPERSLRLNVVHLWEPKPPKGQDPVEWILVTTEPVDTAEQLQTIADHYRARWLIEEFFKALKTGCAYEKRQLESFHALSNALAVFSVVAWRILLARAVSRAQPDAAAATIVTQTQLRLLKHKLGLCRMPATAKEAALAVARLGGHLKRNGDPGWITLGRGFERLLFLEAGWTAAAAHFSRKDVINP
jgi:Transposase DNA-binding/Transposase DDE domain